MHLDREDEAKRILHVYGPDSFAEIMAMLERQFTVLHNRAQVTLGMCGIIISTTGFSGRIIAGTNLGAQSCIVTGVVLVLVSAAVVVWGVLHLRWLTMQAGGNTADWLATALAYRDRKTEFFRYSIYLLLTGLAFYVAAISIMLLNPHASNLMAR